MKFATLLTPSSVYMSRTPFSNTPQWAQWSQRKCKYNLHCGDVWYDVQPPPNGTNTSCSVVNKRQKDCFHKAGSRSKAWAWRRLPLYKIAAKATWIHVSEILSFGNLKTTVRSPHNEHGSYKKAEFQTTDDSSSDTGNGFAGMLANYAILTPVARNKNQRTFILRFERWSNYQEITL